MQEDPTANLSTGTPKKSLPKYLTESECLRLLNNIQSDFYERDYCMITLFLNCGMRLAELVTMNLGDFRDNTIRITGKGNKERLVYLNQACLDALGHYLPAQLKGSGGAVRLQADRQPADGAAGSADRGAVSAERRIVRPRVFTAQTAAHGGHAFVSKRRGHAGTEGDSGT